MSKDKKHDLSAMRQEYQYTGLHEKDMSHDPIQQFQDWFQQAVDAKLDLPNAVILATVNKQGKPSARYVLLKEYDQDGFVFYTHNQSRKGRDIADNPNAALVFYWHAMHRQIHIEGAVEILSEEQADSYFQSRPRGSQISVWAAPQGSTVESREYLQQRVVQLEQEYGDSVIPRPPDWKGFRVVPIRIEFWQGQENRLHDRIVYEKQDDIWNRKRLAP